ASPGANGVRDSAPEPQKPNPDPLEVGTQFALGLGVGPAFDFAPAALVKVGRALVSRADELVGRVTPDLVDLLRTRQRGELDLGLLATGEPTPRAEAGGVRPAEPAERPRDVFEAPGVPEPTVPPQVEPPATRMYHGTGAEFERPEPG